MNTRRNTVCAQGRPGGAGADGAVAVLQRVDGVFDARVVGGRSSDGAGGMAIAASHPRREAGRARTVTRRWRSEFEELELPFDDPADAAADVRR